MSLDLNDRELVALIGPNGAGKTTLMLAISGLVRPSSGTVMLDGKRIDGLEPHQIVARGVSHVPQGRHLFPTMSVAENLEVGAVRVEDSKRSFAARLDDVYSFFPALRERSTEKAGRLSGGQQQMVAIARALMAEPRVLLLDEPSTGLAPVIVEELIERIVALKERGLSILLVEQNAELALELADRVFVMSTGRLRASGAPQELAGSDVVESAYFGHAPLAEP
jgi:branched-chain amino acid transport system ATP-binding protein